MLTLLFLFCTLVPHASKLILGDDSAYNSFDSNNMNQVVVSKQLLLVPGILQNISYYIVAAVGQLTLGIYNSTDTAGSLPCALQATTAAFVPVVGWNTVKIQGTVVLKAGCYW